MNDQAARQRPLTGDPDMPRPGDRQLSQPGLPGGRVREGLRTPDEPVHHRLRQPLPLPVRPDDLVFESVDPLVELLDAVLLEADLILELPDAVLLEMDDLKQLLDQRRAVGFRDIGKGGSA